MAEAALRERAEEVRGMAAELAMRGEAAGGRGDEESEEEEEEQD